MECTIVCVCLQRLEQIIVVALKKKGMQRDHMCFRKCYLYSQQTFLEDIYMYIKLIYMYTCMCIVHVYTCSMYNL